MAAEQPAPRCQLRLGEVGRLEPVSAAVVDEQCFRDLFNRDGRNLVRHRAGRLRVPVESELRVDVGEDEAQPLGSADDDDGREQPGTPDDPLGGADQLGEGVACEGVGTGGEAASLGKEKSLGFGRCW